MLNHTIILNAIVVDGKEDSSPANITSTIDTGTGGTVNSLTIANGGSGYVDQRLTQTQSPPQIGVGIGTTAQGTATISNGVVTGTTITNPGFGYTVAPKTIYLPSVNSEDLDTKFKLLKVSLEL